MRRSAVLSLLLALGCHEGLEPTTHSVVMRDGTELSTDVYLPSSGGPFPVVLYRTPYNKRGDQYGAQGLTDAGVVVVAQDMRGRFSSSGVDGVFTTDGDGPLKDGADTMAWLVEQPWSNGLVGTAGSSALGITQYLNASADPDGLAVMDVEFATPNLYSDAYLYGGVRRYAMTHNWLEEQGSLHFEDEFVAHPYLDEFWDSSETRDQYANVNAPGYHVGGWFDIFSQGTIDAFVGYQHRGGDGALGQQKLVMGPWTHQAPWDTTQGEFVFPDNAVAPPHDNLFDVLFNHWLQLDHPGIGEHPDDIPAVQYYVMGDVDDASAPGNEWRRADDWPPPAAPIRLHLNAAGQLDERCPDADGGSTSYTFDPDDPSPTVCGANLTIEDGPCDQREVEARDDVVLFQTAPLDTPMEITGRVTANLFVAIDTPDADVMVRMTDVYPDGRSMLIADGALRLATRGSTTMLTPLTPDEIVEARVDLWSTSLIVNAGHRLRISITSSNWPRFAVNHNNGLPYPDSVEGPSSPVTVTLHHGGDYASFLQVPDPTRPDTDVMHCDAGR